MKKLFLLFIVSLCFGIIAVLLWAGTAHAKKTAKPPSCNAAVQIFPGDGAGDGPKLNYEDNGDGTFTDCNTKYMWEKKDQSGGVHDVDKTYIWSDSGSAPDGSVANGGPGGSCGFAGFRDWCIPNVKKLQSIVDYSTCVGCNGGTAASSVPGLTASSIYWSATTNAGSSIGAWVVNFFSGNVNNSIKTGFVSARAVRPCS
ncbi:MAG: DUF1566 domain-containing protein [Thermodesulfobacteriota bacterium]